MNAAYREQLLTGAAEGRIREITEYQVNIDNYRAAIELIGDDAQLQEFKATLKNLLESSIIECRKAQIMLDVISAQLTSITT
jgi:transcriptional regulator CtsR